VAASEAVVLAALAAAWAAAAGPAEVGRYFPLFFRPLLQILRL
jgi:hypothetical protein